MKISVSFFLTIDSNTPAIKVHSVLRTLNILQMISRRYIDKFVYYNFISDNGESIDVPVISLVTKVLNTTKNQHLSMTELKQVFSESKND